MSRYDDPQLYPELTTEEEQKLADLYCIENLAAREVAEAMDLSETEVKCVRHRHNLRHGEPAILSEMDEEEAAGHVTEVKRRAAIEKKATRKARREEKKAARKWWSLQESLQETAEAFSAPALSTEPERLSADPELPPAALMCMLHDLHYGKYASPEETGAPYDRKSASELAKEHTRRVLTRAARQADVEKVFMVVGTSDFLHVDSWSGATTSGTPQDTDGTIGDIIAGGQELAIQLIELARQLADVHVVYCPGNHDRIGSQWMHAFLREAYSGADDVTFSEGRSPRQYVEYGTTKALIHHGEIKKSQLKDLPQIIAQEAGWSDFVLAYSGHRHFTEFADRSGLFLRQMLSLSGSDRWHEGRGYVGSKRGVMADLIHPGQGPIASLASYVS